MLRQKLDGDSYSVLRNLHLPVGGETLQVDHVVVSRSGVFVIETRNYSGWISGDESDKRWTLESFRKKFRFTNPCKDSHVNARAVAELLDLDEQLVCPMVVFAGKGRFRSALPSNVMFLAEMVTFIRSHRRARMTQAEACGIADRLLDLQEAAADSFQQSKVEIVDMRRGCPECGAELVDAISNRGGAILGCSNYPKCGFSRSLEWGCGTREVRSV